MKKIIVVLYLLIFCLIGSLIYSVLFTLDLNSEGVFRFNIYDYFIFSGIFFVIAMTLSLPYILICKYILNRIDAHNKSKLLLYFLLSFVSYLIIICLGSYFFMKSLFDTIELVFSFGLIGILIIYAFIKKIS